MATMVVVLMIGLAFLLVGVVVVHLVLKERYGHGEHQLTLYSHKGHALTRIRSTNPRKLHRRRNRALRSRRVGSVELVYANGRRELTFKLEQARQVL
jgi:hypothetical protein